MNQKSNFVVFLVLAVGILIGWFWLQTKIWPPRERPADPKAVAAKAAPVNRSVRLIAERALTVDPLGDVARLAVDIDLVQDPPRRYTSLFGLSEKTKEFRQALPMLPPPLASAWPLVTQMVARHPENKPKREPEPEAKVRTLGKDKHFLRVDLTTRGAGVQKLVLPQFKAANYLGERTNREYELIGDDPITPSYLLYHFPKIDDGKTPPELTLGEQLWDVDDKITVESDGTEQLSFHIRMRDPGFEHIKITKTYRLAPKTYHLGLTLQIEDTRPKLDGKEAEAAVKTFRYQLTGAHGTPVEGGWYTTTYRHALIGTVSPSNDLYRNYQDAMTISHMEGGEREPEGARGDGFLQYAAVAVQYFAAVIAVDDEQAARALGGVDMRQVLAWARPTLESQEKPVRVEDIDRNILTAQSAEGKRDYILLPRVSAHLEELGILEKQADGQSWKVRRKGAPLVISFYKTSDGRLVANWVREGQTPRSYFDDITVRVNSEEIKLRPSEKALHKFLLYHGPVKTRLLGQFAGEKAVEPDLVKRYTTTLHLNTLTDYRSPGPFGAISQAIRFTDLLILVTNLMHTLLHWLYSLVGNYGLAIILLTVIVRGLMFPISRKQALFAQKMQELAPELKKLQAKYKGDARARTEATMEFYRKHKINPLGSCLPLLLQMPIFLGLYFALQESIHFRLAGFLWIDNLAAPDMFVYWSQSIPFISDPDNLGGLGYLGPFFNVLPIAAVALMLVQQKMMTAPPQDEQQASQQRMLKWMMILFGFLFYKVAAGLCIYFIASSLWGVAERKLLPKKAPAQAGPGPDGQPAKPGPGPKGKGGKPEPKPDEPSGPLARVKQWWADVLKKAQKK